MVRGSYKTVIFREARDKTKFLEKMGAAVTGTNENTASRLNLKPTP
jgi:hypothetical protein